MKVAVENAGPCRKQIKVEFTAEEIQQEYDESLAVYAKHGKVKGFRPGKAPVDMIRRMYDKQILESLHEHLLAKGFSQALKEHKLQTVAEYDLQKSPLKPGEPFSFSLAVDVEPEFELPAYKGLEVEAKQVEISDDAVTQAIDRYLESMGKYEDLAGKGEDGAMGIVINKPSPVTMDLLFDAAKTATPERFCNEWVMMGGPVQVDRGFLVHTPVGSWESSLLVTDHIAMTTSRDIIAGLAKDGEVDKAVVTIGYSSWRAGQLEQELADNAWLTAPANTQILFDLPYDQRYQAAIKLLNVDLAQLSGAAGHA